jgi:hypothetical protein
VGWDGHGHGDGLKVGSVGSAYLASNSNRTNNRTLDPAISTKRIESKQHISFSLSYSLSIHRPSTSLYISRRSYICLSFCHLHLPSPIFSICCTYLFTLDHWGLGCCLCQISSVFAELSPLNSNCVSWTLLVSSRNVCITIGCNHTSVKGFYFLFIGLPVILVCIYTAELTLKRILDLVHGTILPSIELCTDKNTAPFQGQQVDHGNDCKM